MKESFNAAPDGLSHMTTFGTKYLEEFSHTARFGVALIQIREDYNN